MPNGTPNLTVTLAVTPAAKPWWHSRTLWLNAVALALAAAESQLQLLQPLLPVNVFALVAFVLPVANAALRFVTTQGVAVSAPKAPEGGQP